MGFPERPELLPEGDAWLLVEFGADSKEDADEQAERFASKLKSGPHVGLKVYEDAGEVAEVWEMREGGVGHSKVPGDHPGWPSWEDSAVAPEQTGDYLRDLERLLEKHGRRSAAYFGHVGHGCLHMRIDFDFLTRTAYGTTGASWRRPPSSCAASTAARCRASTATDRRAASCSIACSAPSSWTSSARSRRSSTRTAR